MRPLSFRLKIVFTIGIALLLVNSGCGSPNSGNSLQNGGVIPAPLPGHQGIGLDYDPEVRCSDDNWKTTTPAACNPQLSFGPCPATKDPSKNLSNCPERCQNCFDTDLKFMSSQLGVTSITLYAPNYYVLKAAQGLGLKVILGTFDDTVVALATPDSGAATCTYAGAPALCGKGAADSLFDGACGATTPWDPKQFCENHCQAGSTCKNSDCSCQNDQDCGGVKGSCQFVSYITAFKDFFDDGTVIGVQLGNEILSAQVNGHNVTKQQILAAAKVMRTALDKRGYSQVPIIISTIAGREKELCENGAPPANVDRIASHPYCNNVASVPPSWPLESGKTPDEAAEACATQVLKIYNDEAVAACGADNTFIGETGYNTGCPMAAGEANHLAVAEQFIDKMVAKTCTQDVTLFLFDYADACPEGGCLPGCDGAPKEGNGYFGVYHTTMYDTKGDLVPKFSPLPAFSCP